MGQASSSRREPSPCRDNTLPEPFSKAASQILCFTCLLCWYAEGRPSRSSSNNIDNDEVCFFSPFHMPFQDLPDVNVSKPIQNWLSMDTISREKHVLHAKHCVLTPYFLFSKEDEYNEKVVSWLQQKQLIPKQSEFKLLSDKHISVADCAEEAMDMILSLMDSSCFLYDICQVVEQTKECRFLSDALNMAKNCHLIDVLLNNFSKYVPSNKIPKDDTGFIILVLLNQAMNHLQKVGDQTDAFEQRVKDDSGKCDALKIKGNGFFNAKKYNKACSFYSQAIKLRPFDAVLYGNRAQSFLSAAKYREALSDARRAICLNPSWEKGYFRYAKAYYHLGFHDKAIAINQQAQKKCSKTTELIQQAVLFTKGRSCSPSSQPTIKRQRISSRETKDSTPLSDDEDGEYSDLPELIDDDTEDELDEPGPSSKTDKPHSTNKLGTSRNVTTISEDTKNSKRVQCSCSHCRPRNRFKMRLKRTSDTVHTGNHNGDDGDDDQNYDDDDCNNKSRQNYKTVSKSGQAKNPSHSITKSSEAGVSLNFDHCVMHDNDDDDDECCAGCEASWTNGRYNIGAQLCRASVNHIYMHDDADDTRDFKIQGNSDSNEQMKSRHTSNKDSQSSSCNIQHVSDQHMPSIDNECGSTSSALNTLGSSKNLEVKCSTSNHHMCGVNCDGCECGSCSSSLGDTQGKTSPSGGVQSNNGTSDDMDGSHSRDSDDDDDEPECICGLCSVNGGDDDDEWEDIDDDVEWIGINDDDDDDSFTDMDLSDLPDLDEPSDEDDDDEDDEDDDDDDDDEAYLFNPFLHMFGSMPPPPLPPQLVLGGEILLLALIRQFIEDHSEFQSEDTPPGALPEVIESLIKKKVTKDLLASSSSCCICQNDYVLDEMTTCLPCNHVYHGPCITTWLKMHATCPTCRDVLPH